MQLHIHMNRLRGSARVRAPVDTVYTTQPVMKEKRHIHLFNTQPPLYNVSMPRPHLAFFSFRLPLSISKMEYRVAVVVFHIIFYIPYVYNRYIEVFFTTLASTCIYTIGNVCVLYPLRSLLCVLCMIYNDENNTARMYTEAEKRYTAYIGSRRNE